MAASCELSCYGPGVEAITRWLARRAEEEGTGPRKPVILAGVAGALDAAHPAGSAWVIERVIGPNGSQWEPTLMPPRAHGGARTAVITSVASVLASAQARRDVARESQAGLVDLESAAFAEATTRAGLQWAIVRGVSDGADAKLPPAIDRWVDEAGRTRPGRVVASLALRPWWLARVIRLRASSQAAMAAVAALGLAMVSGVVDEE